MVSYAVVFAIVTLLLAMLLFERRDLWPYRCHSCALRFYSVERKFGRQKVEAPQAKTTKQNSSGSKMAFRTHGEKPTAAIVVEAESHEQLQQLLTALNGALRSYQQAPKSAEHARRG